MILRDTVWPPTTGAKRPSDPLSEVGTGSQRLNPRYEEDILPPPKVNLRKYGGPDTSKRFRVHCKCFA